jgi:hypothetical protein
MKKAAIGIIAVMLVSLSAFAGDGALKGTYAFQLAGVANIQKANGTVKYVDTRITVGTISFDGAGHAKFLTVANYNNGGGNGPKAGDVWPYTVSGNTGYLGTSGNGAALSLGAYNAHGVAMVVLFLTAGNSPNTGEAVLQ